jgi:hypothetical protein
MWLLNAAVMARLWSSLSMLNETYTVSEPQK